MKDLKELLEDFKVWTDEFYIDSDDFFLYVGLLGYLIEGIKPWDYYMNNYSFDLPTTDTYIEHFKDAKLTHHEELVKIKDSRRRL